MEEGDMMPSMWKFGAALGSSGTYHVYVPGNAGTITGTWTVESGSKTATGTVEVPDCTSEPSNPQASCPVQFQEASVSLSASGSQTVNVILGGDPEGSVTVNLASSCALLSACSLTFDSSNFGVAQQVTVSPNPANPAAVCTIEATSTGDVCAGATLQVTQASQPGDAQGTIYGDPHVVTFFNTRYAVSVTGAYTLLRDASGEFEVQVETEACENYGMCTFGAALQYRSFVARVIMDVDGNLALEKNGETLEAESGVMEVDQADGSLRFSLNTMLQIALRGSLSPSKNQYSLLVAVSVNQAYQGRLYGLLGSYVGGKNADLLLPNGNPTSDVVAFAAAWQVTDPADSLFAQFPSPITLEPLGSAQAYDPAINTPTCS
jgi:hypothetical protein